MAEYIEREKVLEAIYRQVEDCNPKHFNLKKKESYGTWMLRNGINTGVTASAVAVKHLQSVDLGDAKPVVFCRDCGHWCKTSQHLSTCGDMIACCAWFSRHYGIIETSANDFCSYGYRQTTEIPESDGLES